MRLTAGLRSALIGRGVCELTDALLLRPDKCMDSKRYFDKMLYQFNIIYDIGSTILMKYGRQVFSCHLIDRARILVDPNAKRRLRSRIRVDISPHCEVRYNIGIRHDLSGYVQTVKREFMIQTMGVVLYRPGRAGALPIISKL